VDPRAGLDGRNISSPPGIDPGPSTLQSVAIPTELPGPLSYKYVLDNKKFNVRKLYIPRSRGLHNSETRVLV